MKVLISWIAFVNDFENGKVKETGPTASFHEHFYKYDKHILLSSAASEDIREALMHSFLSSKYPTHACELHYLNIQDPIDFLEIKQKLEAFITENFQNEDELTLFISPGTPAMQVAWYFIHLNIGNKTKLLQTREPKFTKNKIKPELVEVKLQKSDIPITASYHEVKSKSSTEAYKITSSIQPIYSNALKVAQTDKVTVLILGDSGSGKEHLARFIHQNSIRKNQAYLTINCSAFSDQLLESRLFGYKKGSFTGANEDSIGIFEDANNGTLFLDEIGDISPYMQQVLLRVLQEKEITPIGGKSKTVDVRIIAATNQHLVNLCKEGKFRWDLYYRLSVVEIDLPNLMQRKKSDLKEMIQFFISKLKKDFNKSQEIRFTKEAWQVLLNYSYPGNIRELENIISRLYVFNEDEITADKLPKRMQQEDQEFQFSIKYAEKKHIEKVLKHHEGVMNQTAAAIGWSVNTLKGKIKEYGIVVGKE